MSVTLNRDPAAIHEVVTRGMHSVLPSPEMLTARLQSGGPMTAYLGIDPTGRELHVGHLSQLQRMRRLQLLGHTTFLLIGDFTGMIGDPSDRSAARVQLTREEVLANAQGYKEQAGRILDFNDKRNPTILRYNSKWLGKMSFAEVIKVASHFTANQMMKRQGFAKRFEEDKPVGLHEFMYPLMQAYDSVKITEGGVDIELGGSDQIFNMMAGRDLIRQMCGKEKLVMAGKLLEDPSGKKIGKTEGNMVTLTDPALYTFANVMAWGDGITPLALELCTTMPMTEVSEIKAALEKDELPGQDGKRILARRIIAEVLGEDLVPGAEIGYNQITSKDASSIDPKILRPAITAPGTNIRQLLFDEGLAETLSAAGRLLQQRGVRVNGVVVDATWSAPSTTRVPVVVHAGKYVPRNFLAVTVSEERAK